MRKVLRRSAGLLTLVLCVCQPAALAQIDPQTGTNAPAGVIVAPSQSSVFNQNSVNLPTAPQPFGQDIVRSAGGASCQTAVASNGPYLDLGVISSEDVFSRQTNAVYGRMVVPLGPKPDRVDCTHLYELEIARLKSELELSRLGAPIGDVPAVLPQPAPVLSRAAPPGPQRRRLAAAPVPVAAAPPLPEPAPEPPPRATMANKAADCVAYAQIGSYSTRARADRAWSLAQEDAPEIFAGRRHRVRAAHREGETVYRLQAGPLTPTAAGDVCRQHDECFVIIERIADG